MPSSRQQPAPTGARTSGLNRPLALLVAVTFFMENLDGTIIATAAPVMAIDLGTEPVAMNAAMTSYLVTLAVGIPISGWLTDRFGGRRIFMIAIALFTIASVLCAASTNLTMLCLMRILQGIGGSMMVPVGRLVVLRSTAKRDLLDATAYITWPALLAPVIAPTLGGWLASYATWHWIFLINVPVGIVSLIAAWRLVPDVAQDTVPRLDWVGFLLCGGFLASLLVGLEQIGHASEGAPTPGWMVASLLIVAAVLGVLFMIAVRRNPTPLLDLRPMRVQTFRVGNASGTMYRLVISAAPFLLPLLFQIGYGWSAAKAGTMLMALFAGNLLIKPVTSPLIRRFGFRNIVIGSCLGGALIFAGCALLTADTPLWVIIIVLFASGVFRSVGFSGYNSLQFADIPAEQMSVANTLSSTLHQIATGLGIAIGALAVRAADQFLAVVQPTTDPAAGYRVAFVVLAVLMLYPVLEAILGLHRRAGNAVTGR